MKSDFYEALPLDARQIEIVRLIADGTSRPAIAAALGMSRTAVTRELRAARELLGATDDAHLVATMFRAGLLAVDTDTECDGQLALAWFGDSDVESTV